jgi:hypothetical protein
VEDEPDDTEPAVEKKDDEVAPTRTKRYLLVHF